MNTIQVKDLKCDVYGNVVSDRIVYLIYPMVVEMPDSLISDLASKYGVKIVVVYVPSDQWNNYLTPWPEPPEEKGFDPFGGKAGEFLAILRDEIVPEVEKSLYVKSPTRYLVGVSLSGLFTLWQWMQCDLFVSIASLSGSFWYAGFMDWFDSLTVPQKKGRAYFLLGIAEPHAKIKAYRSVGVNTESIVSRLKAAGLDVAFDWVPGNHFTDPEGRLRKAFAGLLAYK